MHRCIRVLLSSLAGLFFSSPSIFSLQAVNFGPGRSDRRIKSLKKSQGGGCDAGPAVPRHCWSSSRDAIWNLTPASSDWNDAQNLQTYGETS
jgi:hypothetical protein